MKRRLIVFVFILLLAGCATHPATDTDILKQAENAADQATTWGVPQVGPVAPSVMAFRMQDSLNALLTAHRGLSRPSYALNGTVWIKTIDATKEEVYYFDGADDILIYWVDVTNNRIYTAAGGLVSAQEDLSGANSVSFTGLEAGVRYRLEAEIRGTGGGTLSSLILRFGNSSGWDTGNNYSWSGTRLAVAIAGSSSSNSISLTPGTYLDSGIFIYTIDFSVVPGDDTTAQVRATATGSYAPISVGGLYNGGSNVDRVQLLNISAGTLGTFDGRVRLLRTN